MLEIFESISPIHFGVQKPPGLDYLTRMFQQELSKVVNYYHSRVFGVKNSHLLMHVINHCMAPMEYTDDRFLASVRVKAATVASSLQMTSDTSRGKLFNGVFYGEGNSEIIYYTDEYFDTQYAINNWKSLQPIKVITNSISDCSMLIPIGKNISNKIGLAVISINIPMLMLQYKYFMKEQIAQFIDSQSLIDDRHFLHMYAIPNMLYSQTDYMVINRLKNMYYGIDNSKPMFRHAIAVIDLSDKLDNLLADNLEYISNVKMKYEGIMKSLFSPVIGSQEVACQLPDMPPIRQIEWAKMLSRLELIEFLLDVGGEKNYSLNRVHINSLQRELRRLNRQNIFETILRNDLLVETQIRIEKIMCI